jgi:hypothetical protein
MVKPLIVVLLAVAGWSRDSWVQQPATASQPSLLTTDQIVRDPSWRSDPWGERWRELECSGFDASALGSACAASGIVAYVRGAPATREFQNPITIAQLAGGKVSRILVKRYRERLLTGSRHDWIDVQQEIQRVWSGKVRSATGQITWAELTMWDVFAEIEFASSSRRGSLLTDGRHVQLLDVDGKYWFTFVSQAGA